MMFVVVSSLIIAVHQSLDTDNPLLLREGGVSDLIYSSESIAKRTSVFTMSNGMQYLFVAMCAMMTVIQAVGMVFEIRCICMC